MGDDTSLITELRTNKLLIESELKKVFERWQNERGKKFDDWFQEETAAHANLFWQRIMQFRKDYLDYTNGAPIEPIRLMPTMETILYSEMKKELKAKGIDDFGEQEKNISEFFKSGEFNETPYVQISSMIWATIAKKAANGKKTIPTASIYSDIDMLSTQLPYCDAIFTDKECCSYVNEVPLNLKLEEYETKVFSLAHYDEFLAYLDEIKSSVSTDHLKLIEEVYGPDWVSPYFEIYK